MKTFKQTCNKPYDRHHYELVYNDGKSKVFESYEDAQLSWFQTPGQLLSHIQVLDIKSKKGFKSS